MISVLKRFFDVERFVPGNKRRGALPTNHQAYRKVLGIALPSITEMVLVSMISSVDTIMVGQLGKNALAAVSLPGQPRMIMLSIFFALNVGVTAIVARRKGEGRQADANKTLRNALMLVLFLSVLITILALFFAEPLLRLSGGHTNTADDAEVLKGALSYFRILILALPINAFSMCINAALRGVGNTKITLYVNLVSNLVNVVFNYLLIGGHFGFPRLEVSGAAIASVIGMFAGAVLSLLSVVHSETSYLRISRFDRWRPDKETLRSIIKVGGNAMVEQLSMRFGFFVYSRIMYSLGVTLYASHNICMQFLNLTFSFADGVGIAGTSLVGQSLGEKRDDKGLLYGKVCLRIAMVISAVVGVFIVLFRYPISGLFIDSKTEAAVFVVSAAAEAMLVVALMQPFQMTSVVLSGCLRGAGDNLFVASVMGVCVSVIRPIMALIAVHVLKLGLAGTWLFGLSEMIVRLFLFYRRFEGGKWVEKKV